MNVFTNIQKKISFQHKTEKKNNKNHLWKFVILQPFNKLKETVCLKV